MDYFTTLFQALFVCRVSHDDSVKLNIPPSNPLSGTPLPTLMLSELHPQSLKPYAHCVKRAPIVDIIVGTSTPLTRIHNCSTCICMRWHK